MADNRTSLSASNKVVCWFVLHRTIASEYIWYSWREGKYSEEDIAILRQRLLNVRPEEDNYPMNTTHIFTTNALIDAQPYSVCNLKN